MHQAAGSICEVCTRSDTQLRDTPKRICIREASNDRIIPPILEMERCIDTTRYLLKFSNDSYVGSTDNSRRNNTSRTTEITRNGHH